jgi:GntR family transcriptional regulator
MQDRANSSAQLETTTSQDLASSAKVPLFSPLYQQIKSLLLTSLEKGDWKPGEMIPSEMELAQRFQVSQGTVRKAIDELSQENLLVRKQGKGTFVATHSEQAVQYRFLKLVANPEKPQFIGPAKRDILWCRLCPSSDQESQALQLQPHSMVWHIRRVLSFASLPTILEDLYLPANAFEGLSVQELQYHRGPTYALFETKYGVRMVRAQEQIRAAMPSPEACALLHIEPNVPLLSVERTSFTYQDVPMEIRRALYRTDHHHYKNELN